MYLEDINKNKLVVRDYKVYKASNELWVSIVKNNQTTMSFVVGNKELKGLSVGNMTAEDVYNVLAKKLNGFSVKGSEKEFKNEVEKEITNYDEDFMNAVIGEKGDKEDRKSKKKRRGDYNGNKD